MLPENSIICGDCIEVMREWPANSIDCCVTSPPYWGLRDYGCDGQIGLEKTPQEFVAKMVAVFAEVHRVLKPDGTLWLNLGDSYSSGGRGSYDNALVSQSSGLTNRSAGLKRPDCGLKPKDLCGIPWRVAFALQEFGWYLRQDIIWHKPNPMPESVRDRCTKAHEYIFLLSKSARYFYDAEAIKEEAAESSISRGPVDFGGEKGRNYKPQKGDPNYRGGSEQWGRTYEYKGGKVNKRSVWTVTTKPFSEAHFATFPPDLIEPCILAGCPKGGIVLDPFMGSGTTALVAAQNGRNYIGCELNPDYIKIAQERLQPLYTGVPVQEARAGQMSLLEMGNEPR